MTDELPSKSQRKREMHDLQALGAELVELNDEQLSSMHLPERLMDAVLDARRMSKHEARRRQLQFIGKIMRTVDAGPIREQLAAWKASRAPIRRACTRSSAGERGCSRTSMRSRISCASIRTRTRPGCERSCATPGGNTRPDSLRGAFACSSGF